MPAENEYVRELTRSEIDGLYGGAALVRGEGGEPVPLVRGGAKLQTRAEPIADDAVDVENRTIKLAFSSEAPVLRYFGEEILDHSSKCIRQERIKDSVPVCQDHWLSKRVGKLLDPQFGKDRVGRGTAKLSRVRPEAEYELQDAADGIPSMVSVGYFVHKMVLQEERDDGPNVYRVTDWEPYEVSFVSVAADMTVGIGRSQDNKEPKKEVRDMPDEVKTPEVVQVDRDAIMREGREAERKRRTDIEKTAENATRVLDEKVVHELRGQFLDNGETPEAFLRALNGRMGEVQPLAAEPESADIGLTPKEIREYRTINVLRALALPDSRKAQDTAAFEFEASGAVALKMGRDPKGVFLPNEVMKRDLSANVLADGGALVQTTAAGQSMIEMLRNNLIIAQTGATVIDGLVGDVAIPKQTGGATGYWVHDSDVTESQQTLGQVNLVPHTAGALTDIKRSLLKQSSISAEMFVQSDIASTIAHMIDTATFNGTGTAGQPRGIANTTGIGTEDITNNAPTLVQLGGLWEEVAKDNVRINSGAFITNAQIMAWMMTTETSAGSGKMLIEDGKTLGYSVYLSEAIASGYIYFGNFSDLVVGMWGAMDLTVDPYKGAAQGTLRIIALQDVDVAVRHPESFAAGV